MTNKIPITLNGEPQKLTAETNLVSLADQLGLTGKRYAIEINELIIPRSQHVDTLVQADDRIEFVVAIGGG